MRRLAGWLLKRIIPEKSRRFLLAMIQDQGICAEVGVWKGDFAQEILDRARPSKLLLIDPWKFEASDDYDHAWYGGAEAKSQQDMDAIHDAVAARFASHIKRGVVELLRQPSTEAAAAIAPASLDWVYIDGNHQYEFVIEDLRTFYERLRPGGVLAGDDYGTKGWWDHGVTRAVDEFAKLHAADSLIIKGSQFALVKS